MTPGTPLAQLIDEIERRATPGTGLPTAAEIESIVRQVEPNAKLVDRFVEAARTAGAQVERVRPAAAAEAILAILKQHGIRSLLVAAGAAMATIEDAFRAAGIDVVHARDEATMFGVDAALTGVAAAVAETGSIFVRSGEHCSQSSGTRGHCSQSSGTRGGGHCSQSSGTPVTRGESLIPPVHIAMIRPGQIMPDLCDVFADPVLFRASSNCTVITGPSKTADIEGVLVTGVHGPGQLVLIVLDESG